MPRYAKETFIGTVVGIDVKLITDPHKNQRIAYAQVVIEADNGNLFYFNTERTLIAQDTKTKEVTCLEPTEWLDLVDGEVVPAYPFAPGARIAVAGHLKREYLRGWFVHYDMLVTKPE